MTETLRADHPPDDCPAPLDIDLATPDPIPEEGVARASELLRTGRLFRYGEVDGSESEAALWESEFAHFVGRRYALGVNSCGAALYLALHCVGVRAGDPVLLNSWTLAPVPGAVQHVGANAVLVETTPDLTIDLADLRRQAQAHPGSVLLLSHMRGHVADLEAVSRICREHDLRLVEDCAHSLGARWAGQPTGTFGHVACFSTQTYKHLNSGEGGLLVTDDADIAARAILASGSYMLYGQHTSRPELDRFDALAPLEPNHSMRLTSLAAAMLRPQLRTLPERVEQWNTRYDRLSEGLSRLPGLRLTRRSREEEFVGSSLQFFAEDLTPEQISRFCATTDELGVHVKWFGAPQPVGFTSTYRSWRYARRADLSGTDHVLSTLLDIRIPVALPLDRCDDIVAIIAYALARAAEPQPINPPTADEPGSTS